MNIWLDNFSAPKFGNTAEEVEDTFCPKNEDVIIRNNIFIALADGATDGTFSKYWAECLVSTFCNNYKDDFPCFIEESFARWDTWKRDYINLRNDNNKPLYWYEEAGFLRGSFSTLLGLHLIQTDNENSGKWKAVAIGDTCLFQIRNKQLIHKFPISNSIEFNTHPTLVSSNRELNNHLKDAVLETEGRWETGDDFYLMTDALSSWFLCNCEKGESPWEILKTLYKSGDDFPSTYEYFPTWIEKLRIQKYLHNDDVTLLRINII